MELEKYVTIRFTVREKAKGKRNSTVTNAKSKKS